MYLFFWFVWNPKVKLLSARLFLDIYFFLAVACDHGVLLLFKKRLHEMFFFWNFSSKIKSEFKAHSQSIVFFQVAEMMESFHAFYEAICISTLYKCTCESSIVESLILNGFLKCVLCTFLFSWDLARNF